MINKFYGKNKERTKYIINKAIKNKDKKIMIIDFEKNNENLYPLIELNSINIILLNSDISDVMFYFDLIEDIDEIIINGYQNIKTFDEIYQKDILEIIEELKNKKNIFILSKDKDNGFKKIIKEKNKKIEVKIFKINKFLNLNIENIYNVKRNRIKMIEGKII